MPTSNHEIIDTLIGNITDIEVAKITKLTRERIRQIRKSRGIPRVKNSFGSPKYKHTQEIVDKMMDLPTNVLGVIPDSAVSIQTGISAPTIKRYRDFFGIPNPGTAYRKSRKLTPEKIAELLLDAGNMPDSAVAEKHNVVLLTVFRFRKERNIPSFRSKK